MTHPNTDRSAALLARWAEEHAFVKQCDVFYAAFIAKYAGEIVDAAALELAKDTVSSWLRVRGWPGGDATSLDGAELVGPGWLFEAPDGLSPENVMDALSMWLGWLRTCGVFDDPTLVRLLYQLERCRMDFVERDMFREPVSESPPAVALIEEFLTWLYDVKKRPEDPLQLDDAPMAAAIDMLGDANGDMRTLNVREWLESSAVYGFEEARSPSLRDLMRDTLEWLRLRGRLSACDGVQMRDALDQARHQIRAEELLSKESAPPIEA